MQSQLASLGHSLCIVSGRISQVFAQLHHQFGIRCLHSHQEVGIQRTFERDLWVQHWCQQHQIPWQQAPYGAVIRGRAHRRGWHQHWQRVMQSKQANVSPNQWQHVQSLSAEQLGLPALQVNPAWLVEDSSRQSGGSQHAWHVLKDFFQACAYIGAATSYKSLKPIFASSSTISIPRIKPSNIVKTRRSSVIWHVGRQVKPVCLWSMPACVA